ncbi:uncharacterized protein LOC142652979 [Rhinoderma darwinii]|uniref:uncharacterized protein LOC142652979 n=1 Tax=Rhinoderma darwinii TaxID=43563 RepID=UPI003F6654CC
MDRFLKYLPARSRDQTHVTEFVEPGKKSRRWNFFQRHPSKVEQRPAGSFDNIIDVPKKEPKNVARTRKRFWKCINRRKAYVTPSGTPKDVADKTSENRVSQIEDIQVELKPLTSTVRRGPYVKIKVQIPHNKTKKRSIIYFFRKKFGLEELQPPIPKKKHVDTQVTEVDLDKIIKVSTSTSTNSYLQVSVATQTEEDDLRNISEVTKSWSGGRKIRSFLAPSERPTPEEEIFVSKPLPPIGRQLIVIKEANSINKVTVK